MATRPSPAATLEKPEVDPAATCRTITPATARPSPAARETLETAERNPAAAWLAIRPANYTPKEIALHPKRYKKDKREAVRLLRGFLRTQALRIDPRTRDKSAMLADLRTCPERLRELGLHHVFHAVARLLPPLESAAYRRRQEQLREREQRRNTDPEPFLFLHPMPRFFPDPLPKPRDAAILAARRLIIDGLPRGRVEEGEKLECAFQLEDLPAGTRVAKLPCGHRFEAAAIRTWLETSMTCPLCRGRVIGDL